MNFKDLIYIHLYIFKRQHTADNRKDKFEYFTEEKHRF